MKNSVKIYKFPNKATLIYKKRKLCDATAVVAGFYAGHEYIEDIEGVPHFVEHLLFNGTNKRTKDEITKDMSKITSINAYTSNRHIAVEFFESNTRVNECFEFASDILLNTSLNEESLESEKKVVFEENQRAKDQIRKNIYSQHFRFMEPKFKLTEDFRLGTPETLGKVTTNDVKSFINRHFVSDKFFISVVTSLPFRKIKKLAQKYFIDNLSIPTQPSKLLPTTYYQLNADEGVNFAKTEDKTVKCLATIKFNVENGLDYMFDYNLTCIASRMNVNPNTFYNEARKQGLVYMANAAVNYNNLSNVMTFDFEFQTSKLENVDKIFSLIGDTIRSYKTNYLSDDEINDYVDKRIISLDKSYPAKYLESAGKYINQYDKYGKIISLTKKEKIANFNKVTKAEIKKHIDLIFNKNNKVYITFMGDFNNQDFKTIDEYKSILFKD